MYSALSSLKKKLTNGETLTKLCINRVKIPKILITLERKTKEIKRRIFPTQSSMSFSSLHCWAIQKHFNSVTGFSSLHTVLWQCLQGQSFLAVLLLFSINKKHANHLSKKIPPKKILYIYVYVYIATGKGEFCV